MQPAARNLFRNGNDNLNFTKAAKTFEYLCDYIQRPPECIWKSLLCINFYYN